MKLSQLVRLGVTAITLTGMATTSHAQTIIGPGVVPTPIEMYGGHYRIVAGAEAVRPPVQAPLVGGVGMFTYGDRLTIEGGRLEGASVYAAPNQFSATAGAAIIVSVPAWVNITILGGVVRGGSVIVDAPTLPGGGYVPGSAIVARSQDQIVDLTIRGGVIEGGKVALASAPETALSRAPALHLASQYGRSVDIHGGTIVGGIELASRMRFTVHGSNFNISPPPVNGRIFLPATFTLSGNYADGTPFSHSIHSPRNYEYSNGRLVVSQTPTSLTLLVPEPAAASLATVGLAAFGALRRRSRRRA